MNRRKFIRDSIGLVGAFGAENALAKLCPPQNLKVVGGIATTPNVACSVPNPTNPTAEADWIARSTGPGVMWAHDFRSDSEITRFLFANNIGYDPARTGEHSKRVFRQTSDGITGGGCLEIFMPAGSNGTNAHWWRPFSALPGDRGYTGGPDFTPKPLDSPSFSQWPRGTYGHQDYHDGTNFDGTEFYIQFRVKFSASRSNSSTPGGKLAYLTRMEQSLTAQEIVLSSSPNPVFSWYSAGGKSEGHLKDPQGSGTSYSPPIDVNDQLYQNQYPNCKRPFQNASNCWAYRFGQWDTILIHVRPGHENDNHIGLYTGTARKDTLIQVWGAHQGETTYTKIWDKPDFVFDFSNLYKFGWNAFICSGYMNNQAVGADYYHRYDQIIFSKQFIPCPKV